MNHSKSINTIQRLQTYNLLPTKSILQSKSTNTLQYNHLTNILLAQEWGLRGARGYQRGWIEPTRVYKGLESVMSMWSLMD
jgi:hypothetical protein